VVGQAGRLKMGELHKKELHINSLRQVLSRDSNKENEMAD
jgi:hypothetical protein